MDEGSIKMATGVVVVYFSRFGKPLSGQGIIWAIDDAVAAMELLTRMEWRDLIQHMRARTANEVHAYCLERSRVYLSEQRFKNDAYWSAIPDHLRLNEIGPLAPEN